MGAPDITADLARPADWTRVDLPSGRSVLGRNTGTGQFAYLPASPGILADKAGVALVSSSVALSRMPGLYDRDVAALVTGGVLSLTGSLAVDMADAAALRKRQGVPCVPAFTRGSAWLRCGKTVLASVRFVGTEATFRLDITLDAEAARSVLNAFAGQDAGLTLSAGIERPWPVLLQDQPLAGLLAPLRRAGRQGDHLHLVVLTPDGSVAAVPSGRRESLDRPGTRDMAAPASLLQRGATLTALPFAMAPGTTAHPAAAQLIAGGAVGPAIQAGASSHVFVANDAVGSDDGNAAPTQHYPMVSDPAAPYWPDAMDAGMAWYAPGLTLVTPAPGDDPANAAFSMTVARTGTIVGAGGAAQPGLRGTVRLTVAQSEPAATASAIAGANLARASAVPLQNLSVALELSYRQSGAATVLTQRFPGRATPDGSRIVIEVDLLDDWVRLAYSAIAYPSEPGMPPPRLIVDYAFTSYARIRVPISDPEEPPFVGGGIHHPLPMAAIAEPQARMVAVMHGDPDIIGARLPVHNLPIQPRPHPIFGVRLVTRSIVREEAVAVALPCATFGAFYLQRADSGVATAIGCQDSLKLGEIALRAFAEVESLRTPKLRVWRSLQQPSRAMLVPTAYRIGRYGPGAGANAYRPMVALYGIMDPDPAKIQYALNATLVPDVSAGDIAQVTARLGQLLPTRDAPGIVYPTDPFVGAQTRFTWVVPDGWQTPQAVPLVDAILTTVTMPMSQALVLMAMIDRSGLQGAVTFTLPDGTTLVAALTVDGTIIGPSDTGPVTVAVAAGAATLTNRTQDTMHVTDLVTTAGAATGIVAADVTLAPGATAAIAVDPATTAAFAEAVAAAAKPIEELDVFIEDVTTAVTFINQVNFANHGLTAMSVKARLKDSPHEQTADLPEGKTAVVSFTLPVTTYLAHKTLQYALVETQTTGTTVTPWRDWDLGASAVIGITPDQI